MQDIFRKIWQYFQIILKVALAGALFVVTWVYLTPYFRVKRNLDGDHFRNMPKDTVDVLALGSSHMQYAFNPAIFYANSGYYSYVLGSSCQPMAMSYSLLQEALKTQHPSVVLLDVFTLLEQSSVCYADGMYYLAMQETTGNTWYEAADQVPNPEVALNYKYDLLMNHSNWKTMDFSNLNAIIDSAKPSRDYDWALGYVRQEPEDLRYVPLITYQQTEKIELTDLEKQQLDQIINLCDQENIKLIFLKTPYIIDQEDTNKLDAIWDYLDSKGQAHLDFIQMAADLHWFIGMDGDTWHNNSWGADIITSYLAQYVKDGGYIKNHQDNSVYQDLLKGAAKVAASSLLGPANLDVYRLLDDVAKYPCTLLVKYSGSSSFPIGEYENGLLQSVGISRDFLKDPNHDYYAIIQDGKVVQESDQPIVSSVNGHPVELNADGILLDQKAVDADPGQMELVFAADDFSWMNPIGIEPGKYGFWKKGCYSWACGADAVPPEKK